MRAKHVHASSVVGLAAVTSAAVIAWLLAASPVSAKPLACSAGPDWNAVAESDVIVAGLITGYRPAGDVTGAPPPVTPIELTWDVDRVLKGIVQPTDHIIDTSSLDTSQGITSWHGTSGACGAFSEDPTHRYAILGLSRAPDGTLRTNLLKVFYLKPDRYSQADVQTIQARVGALPATGSGSTLAASPGEHPLARAIASLGSLGALVAHAGVLARRSGRRT